MATTLRGDDNFDSASPIPAGNFTAKAWVNFNSTNTVAIRDSGNVSSITDNATGQYTVNFTTAMPDANYSCPISTNLAGVGVPSPWANTYAASSVNVYSYRTDSSAYADTSIYSLTVTR